MSTWYKADHWCNRITTVEVVKETAAYVTLADDRYERRCAKRNEYFPTFKEARTYLMEHFRIKGNNHAKQSAAAHENWIKLFKQEEPDNE
jgi:hypothetical protein